MTIHAGVLAVQGDVAEHASAVERAGREHDLEVTVEAIREPGVVPDCDRALSPAVIEKRSGGAAHGADPRERELVEGRPPPVAPERDALHVRA